MVSRTSALPLWTWVLLSPCAVLLPGCTTEQAATPAPANIVFEMRALERTLRDCQENLSPCASIALEFPEIQEAPSEEGRAGIEGFVHSCVLAPLEEGAVDSTAEQIMERFLSGYREFAADFPEQSSQWVMTREVAVIHNAGGVFSVEFTETSYTGGAHPNTSVSLASFDAGTGQRLTLDDLFVEDHGKRLEAIAEQAFRTERSLSRTEDLSEAGFWFENGAFRLNDNFAVVPGGLKYYFNAYEVGPYAMGPTSMVLGTESLAALILPSGPLARTSELTAGAP